MVADEEPRRAWPVEALTAEQELQVQRSATSRNEPVPPEFAPSAQEIVLACQHMHSPLKRVYHASNGHIKCISAAIQIRYVLA